MKTIIIIPSRMASKRFPNKPMARINGKPMIQRVWEQALASKLGEVIVACCENQVYECIKSLGGEAILTDPELPSGTDRVYQALAEYDIDQYDSIINLQGDMPMINPNDIGKVNLPLIQGFDMGSLVTDLKKDELEDKNITKARVSWIKKNIIGHAKSFTRSPEMQKDFFYHHVGIYSFKYKTLKKFVSLPQSKNEINNKLEQFRAVDANMSIGVSYIKDVPISVDTKEDLIKIEKITK